MIGDHMFLTDRWRPIIGGLLLSFLIVGLAEYLFAALVVFVGWKNDMDLFTPLLSEPLSLFARAWEEEVFVKVQVAFFATFLLLSFKLHKVLSGNSNYLEASKYGAFGTSRFAKPQEVFNDQMFAKKTWNRNPQKNLENPPGLIFGLLKNKPVILPENTKIPNRNVFIVGSPGSGKTQSFILTNIIHEQHRSIVVTDPKGEIFEATAKLKKQQGYEVRLINFKEMAVSARYNPIDYIHKEIEAEQVATTIVLNSQNENKSQPDFWTRAEVALLKTLLLYVKYECPKEATMSKVKEILTEHGKTPQEMDRFFERLPAEHPAYQSYMIVRMAEKNVRASIFISLGITLSKFDPKDVRRFTETSDFQLDDLGKKKMILYCILPVADSTWEPLISTFFTQMFQRLYDVADKNFNKLPVKVNLLLDEFPNLGQIPGYEEILATCRSYGMSASTIVQSLGQLYDKYSKEKAEAIVGNCSLRYLLGVGDKLTAEYFSDLIGKTTIRTHSLSNTKKGFGKESTSESYSERNLVTPDELTRMDRKEAILLVSGMYAIKLFKAFQFEFFADILTDDLKISRFDYDQLVDREPERIDVELEKPEIEFPERTSKEKSKEEKIKEIYLDMERLGQRIVNEINLDDLELDLNSPTEEEKKEQKPKKRRRRRRRRRKSKNRQNEQGLSVDN